MNACSLTWARTYPCLAAVMAASFQTLDTWQQHLPAPQTDVERTIRRRLALRIAELAPLELRKVDPALADKYDALLARLAALGMKATTV